MKRGIQILIMFFLLSIFGFRAYAEVVTSCGGSRGYVYIFPGGLVPSFPGAWKSDNIPNGGIIFTFDGEKADIIIRDATDITKSVKEGGAIVEVLHVNSSADLLNTTFLIMVYYPAGALEHYLFKLDENGVGKVVWGTAKAAGPLITNKLMVADCKK